MREVCVTYNPQELHLASITGPLLDSNSNGDYNGSRKVNRSSTSAYAKHFVPCASNTDDSVLCLQLRAASCNLPGKDSSSDSKSESAGGFGRRIMRYWHTQTQSSNSLTSSLTSQSPASADSDAVTTRETQKVVVQVAVRFSGIQYSSLCNWKRSYKLHRAGPKEERSDVTRVWTFALTPSSARDAFVITRQPPQSQSEYQQLYQQQPQLQPLQQQFPYPHPPMPITTTSKPLLYGWNAELWLVGIARSLCAASIAHDLLRLRLLNPAQRSQSLQQEAQRAAVRIDEICHALSLQILRCLQDHRQRHQQRGERPQYQQPTVSTSGASSSLYPNFHAHAVTTGSANFSGGDTDEVEVALYTALRGLYHLQHGALFSASILAVPEGVRLRSRFRLSQMTWENTCHVPLPQLWVRSQVRRKEGDTMGVGPVDRSGMRVVFDYVFQLFL